MEENKLSELELKAKQKAENQDPFMPSNEPKKGRGRPKGSTNETKKTQINDHPQKSEIQKIPTKDLCYPIALGVSSLGVSYARSASPNDPRAQNAAMNKDETEAFCIGLSMIIDKYLPDAMGKYGPEIVFLTFLTQYSIRVYATHNVLKHDREKAEQSIATSAPIKNPKLDPWPRNGEETPSQNLGV